VLTLHPLSQTHNPEARISELAERCLRRSAYLDLKAISCVYREGVLVLRGRLPTYFLKQMAQEVVAHLAGVEDIENRIEVVTPASRSE
jgi:osmotically-inducible protein OsmY